MDIWRKKTDLRDECDSPGYNLGNNRSKYENY